MMNAWSLSFAKPISYNDGLELQLRILKARQEGRIPDTVLVLQHTPVITLGNRGRDNHLLKTAAEYRELGIELHHAERGGDVTFHGPGIAGFRREGKSGAWTAAGKVAAIGFRLKKWVSFHGMGFNVRNELSGFNTIVPCGLVGEPVATMQTILGDDCPSMERVRDALLDHFSAVCHRGLERFDADGDMPPALRELVRGQRR
jgi:lipoate-protein ligase B